LLITPPIKPSYWFPPQVISRTFVSAKDPTRMLTPKSSPATMPQIPAIGSPINGEMMTIAARTTAHAQLYRKNSRARAHATESVILIWSICTA